MKKTISHGDTHIYGEPCIKCDEISDNAKKGLIKLAKGEIKRWKDVIKLADGEIREWEEFIKKLEK